MDGPDNHNPRLDVDELFDRFFDYTLLCSFADPSLEDRPSAHALDGFSSLVPPRRSPPSPPLLDHRLSLDELDPDLDLVRMTARESDLSAQTPPDLVQGGSTSPSDHSGSLLSDQVDDSHHHPPHVTLREAQAHDDEWTYPQTDAIKAVVTGYPPHIHVQGDGPSSAPAAGQKRRRSLNDPEKTADVRKTGACLPCRLTKTRCHESGVCPACRKSFPSQSHLVCTRKTPAMAWPILTKGPDVWSRNARLEEMLCSGPRKHIGKPKEISIFLTSDTSSPPLLATVQPYTSTNDPEEATSLNKADFPSAYVPSYPKLQAWVEDQIRREPGSEFPQTLQKFLLAYAHGGRSLPKHELVGNVHTLNCFFRIWKTSSFSCRDPTNKMANLPLSVQARLRSIARGALKSYEYKVLKALDECLGQHSQPKPSERMAIWASLWQLILMYRDLLKAFVAKRGSTPASQVESFDYHHKQLAETYFPLMAIFYHCQFRNKKNLDEASMDFLHDWQMPGLMPQQRAELIGLSQELLGDARKNMYQALKDSRDTTDYILYKLVIENELSKLKARKRSKKDGAKPMYKT
ncbi:hypothetical protein GQ602_007209 [Ophiocordyceps camponoti-floridani]|uniref:Uncharacterized protein n=1 Tax=Ophiocordyceps camponoti-floridani TaxID=2030778 RepID=A0A8H4VAM6_9HYPO|nr:hypothetical protein GQ602_007209 [Ophiocordyceps camponoti-floridani]